MNYLCRRAHTPPSLVADWSDPTWSIANVLCISHFHPTSTDHRPITLARMLHTDQELFVQFNVQDRYVRCVTTEFQGVVSQDSCVECFLQPLGGSGYFNFEINCGGTMLVYYIEDPTRGEEAFFRKFTVISAESAASVRIAASLPKRIEPEMEGPVDWGIALSVPLSFFEQFVGKLGILAGQTWRGNFFKCGDRTSHPHWGAWNPIGDVLRFHQPDRFGVIQFEMR